MFEVSSSMSPWAEVSKYAYRVITFLVSGSTHFFDLPIKEAGQVFPIVEWRVPYMTLFAIIRVNFRAI